MVELRDGANAEGAVSALRHVANEADNLAGRTAGKTPMQILDFYLSWAENAQRSLGNVLVQDVIDELIHTQGYWALRTTGGETVRLTPQILAEADRRKVVLNTMADDLERESRRWRPATGMLVVPDTNMFLQEEAPIDQIDWPTAVDSRGSVRLVIPIVVVYELDRAKRNNLTKKRARDSLAWLRTNLPPQPEGRSRPLSPGYPETTVEVYVQGGPPHPEDADGLIIRFAGQLAKVSGLPTRLVTRDLTMRLRASTEGVAAMQLPDC